MNSLFEYLYINKFCFWLAAFGTVIYSFYHAFMHPSNLVRPEDLSSPNFIRPGEDFGFGVSVNAFGFILDVIRFYWNNILWMLLVIAMATVLQTIWRKKISQIEI